MSSDNQLDQARAIASLPHDIAIIKLENDSMQAMAAARPRDFELIKAELLEQFKSFPVMAEDAIYSKPVGTNGDGSQKFARNLSVRSAEAIAEVYGYNRVSVDVTPIDDDHVKVSATFTDFQRGRIWTDGGIMSKFYKSREGKTVRTSEDRFYNVVVKAEASRRVREVILRCVSPGLKAWYWEEAEKISNTLLDDKTVEKIVNEFANLKITLEQLEKSVVGRPRSAGWTMDDRRRLLETRNAIKNGETTVAEVLSPPAGMEGAKAQQSSLTETLKPAAEPKKERKPKAEKPVENQDAEPDPWRDLDEGLSRAVILSREKGVDVGLVATTAIEVSYSPEKYTDAQLTEVHNRCQAAREKVRRGERSNQKAMDLGEGNVSGD